MEHKSHITSDVTLQGSGVDRFIRMVESLNAFNGGFIQMEGSTNKLHIGVHDANDDNAANDQKVITLLRSNGNVGVGTENPGVEFEVVGSIQVDGALLAPTFTNIVNRLAVVNPSFGSSRLGDGALQTPSLDVEVINFMGAGQVSNFAIFENNNVLTVRSGGGDKVGVLDFNGGNQADYTTENAEATYAATINYTNGFGYVSDVGVQRYVPGSSVVAQKFFDVMINSGGAPRLEHIKTYYDGTTYEPIRYIGVDGIMRHEFRVKGQDGVDPDDFVTKSQLDAAGGGGGGWTVGAAQSVTSGTAATSMFATSIPAGTLANDGDVAEFEFFFAINGTVGVTQSTVSYNVSLNGGGTTIGSLPFASGGYINRLVGKIIRKSATSVIFDVHLYFAIDEYKNGTQFASLNRTVSNLNTSANTFEVFATDTAGNDSWTLYGGYISKYGGSSGGGGGGGLASIVAGDNIDVDVTDPDNPIVSATQVVTTNTSQNITATKTFTSNLNLNDEIRWTPRTPGSFGGSSGRMTVGVENTNAFYVKKLNENVRMLLGFNNLTQSRRADLPDEDGEIALSSEGTFTPVFKDDTSGDTFNVTGQFAYFKVGKMVTIQIRIQGLTIGSAVNNGNLAIDWGSLPFPCAVVGGNYNVFGWSFNRYGDMETTFTNIGLYANVGGINFEISQNETQNNTGQFNFLPSPTTNKTNYLSFNFSYWTT